MNWLWDAVGADVSNQIPVQQYNISKPQGLTYSMCGILSIVWVKTNF